MSEQPLHPAAAPFPPSAAAPVQHRAGGLAVAALVLGIVGLLAGVVPFLCFVAFLPAVAAVVVGAVALRQRTTRRGMGLTGLILGGAGILVALAMTVVSIFLIVHIVEAVRDEQRTGGLSDGSSSSSPFDQDSDDAVPESAGPFLDGYVVRGSGEDVVPIGSVDGDTVLGVATVTVTGGSSFEIYGRDADGEDVEWVTDGQGGYTGDVVFNTLPGDAITAFHVTSDADWTIELHSTYSVPSVTSELGGSGDDVLYYDGSATSAALTCTSGTAISVWSEYDGTLVEGEPCPYTGTFELPSGGGLLQILATGDWTFSPVVEVT